MYLAEKKIRFWSSSFAVKGLLAVLLFPEFYLQLEPFFLRLLTCNNVLSQKIGYCPKKIANILGINHAQYNNFLA